MEDRKSFNENRRYNLGRHHRSVGRIAGWTCMGMVFAAIFALVFGILVKWLWNAVMPPIFSVGEIGYWQAVGLVLLTKLLFGSFAHSRSRSRIDAWPGSDYHPRDPRSFCRGEAGMRDRFRKWHYYKEFWADEGQAAFDDYVARREQKGKEQADHDQ